MKKYIGLLIGFTLFACHSHSQELLTEFEKSNGTKTADYFQVIDFYRRLDKASPKVLLKEMGMTDAGFPLHLVLFSNDGNFDPASWHKQNKAVILVNNGIHPGEPDGIDASMLLVRDLVKGTKKIANNVVLAFIPVYNIGGCLNRSANYRVDQDGPDEFGSRGNSQNLDLNRDFIKCDSKEARSFARIFHFLDPDVFVDNHVSNGADYQHVMTLICSQHDKLGGVLGEFMNKEFEPGLYALMKEKGYEMVPYVNFFGELPERGWPEFYDSPRYSSGFAALWNTFGFITETHMLKPFRKRVESTYALMESFIHFTSQHSATIRSIRLEAKKIVETQLQFPISWRVDSSKYSVITFKGYEAGTKPSAVSGLPRLFYDRKKPFEKKVNFYNQYKPVSYVEKPSAYVIPQGWWKVIELLKLNNVQMRRLAKDTVLGIQVYYVDSYTSSSQPYEMHHLNRDVGVRALERSYRFRKGDYYIPMNQPANRFLIEVLEPQSADSYFTWNFFDGILGQKEGYSNYVFEDTAEQFLRTHPDVRLKLEQKKTADSAFARDAVAQLDFVFKNSPYVEPEYLRYPVYRVVK